MNDLSPPNGAQPIYPIYEHGGSVVINPGGEAYQDAG